MAITIRETDLRFNSNHQDRIGAPKGILLHHAASSGSVEEIHAYHKNINGWAGIGYHIYVRKNGNVFRGRPENWLGGHATGFNDYLGVCAEGNFETETMPAAQKEALIGTLIYLFEKYGELSVKGHRDVAKTACPGKNYPLAEIVKTARERFAAQTAPQATVNQYVLAFQKAAIADGVALPKYGADGVWGSETQAAADHILTKGATGKRVETMQSLLQKAGYHVGVDGADGIYGTNTEKAVNAFKEKIGLPQNGRVGIKVWKALLGV